MARHYIRFKDLNLEEYRHILGRAAALKAERFRTANRHLAGRAVGMIFNKHSTRTRISFEVGIGELGGRAIFMTDSQTQFARGEPISHSARVLSRYLAALVIRTFDEGPLLELSRYGSIPVINGLTDQQHPCQVLADIFTIGEKKGFNNLEKLKIAWVGDGNNMANSWIEAAAVFGFALSLACPAGYWPDAEVLKSGQARNPRIVLTESPKEALGGADAVNTDVWASMGREEEQKTRARAFAGYQVNSDLMAAAAPEAVFLHCLPAHPGEEVTEEVLESPASVIFDQAENRLHAQKALLEFLIPALA